MKKVLAIGLSIVLLLSVTMVCADSNHPFYGDCWCTDHLNGTLPYTPGDTNRDGKIDSFDALKILRYTVSRVPSSTPIYTSGEICPSFLVMDVNNKDRINADDALEVLKYVVGKVDGFARQPVYYQPESPTDA